AVSGAPFLKVTFAGAVGPTYVRGSLVSGSYFSVLGLSPSHGRLLSEGDDEIAGTPGSTGCAAVISHRFWIRQFQQDPAAVGRALGEPLRIVMAMVSLVLLIATFNAANLMLARGAARAPELGTRTALGAGRGRLVRQVATEGGLLAALGGLLGVELAYLG